MRGVSVHASAAVRGPGRGGVADGCMRGGVHGRSRQAVARRSKRAQARAAPAAAWRGPADRALAPGGGVGMAIALRFSVGSGLRPAGGRAESGGGNAPGAERGGAQARPGGARRAWVAQAAGEGRELGRMKEFASRARLFPGARRAVAGLRFSLKHAGAPCHFVLTRHSGTREMLG